MTITPAMAMANSTSQPEPLRRRTSNDRDMAVSFTSEPDEFGEVPRGGELRSPVSIPNWNHECKKIRTRGGAAVRLGSNRSGLPESRNWGLPSFDPSHTNRGGV